MLKVEQINVNQGDIAILTDVSFQVFEHDIFMIVGPNGAGKTTLIKAIMQTVPHSGHAYLKGTNIADFTPKELAKQIGVLTQIHRQQFEYTVYEVVSLGRYAHLNGMFSRLSGADQALIHEAMCLTGIEHLRNRSVATLSGGELQRVFLAQLFAQNPSLFILDEPLNHLDLQYQLSVFDLLKEWVKGNGRAVVAVVHDLNIAYSYGTRALLLHQGIPHAYGSVDTVLNRKILQSVYQVDVAGWMLSLLDRWNDSSSHE